MNQEEFFYACEERLGPMEPGRTIGRRRWRRGAGQGRWIGRGQIKWFSPTCIQVMWTDPFSVKTYSDPQHVIDYLDQKYGIDIPPIPSHM